MMTAKEAAKHTIVAIKERNSLQELEALILNEAKAEQHCLQLPLHKVTEIFGEVTSDMVSVPARHPIPLRVAWSEMARAGYSVGFNQYSDLGWCLDISWKTELTF